MGTASVAPTDTVPLVELGSFAPLQSETFTLTSLEPAGYPFQFVGVGFFVAPEPASLGLLGIGAAGLLLRRRRRA